MDHSSELIFSSVIVYGCMKLLYYCNVLPCTPPGRVVHVARARSACICKLELQLQLLSLALRVECKKRVES